MPSKDPAIRQRNVQANRRPCCNSYLTFLITQAACLIILAPIGNLTANGTENPRLAWGKNVGGPSQDYPLGVGVDSLGNLYVAGYFSNTARFGGLTITSVGNTDIFLAKYDSVGNALWVKQAGGEASDLAFDLAVDPDGNSYVTEFFGGKATFGSTVLTSTGGNDIFVAKFSPNGDELWARRAGGSTFDDTGFDLALDTSQNLYVTGYFNGTADFGGVTVTSGGAEDVFVAKYTTSGDVVWVRSGGGPSSQRGHGIAADRQGNVYVTGPFQGQATFSGKQINAAQSSIFVVRYNSSGDCNWAIPLGGISRETGKPIATDSAGNVYLLGYIPSTSVQVGSFTASSSHDDSYLAKIDNTGTVTWVRQASGSASISAWAVATSPVDQVYVTGQFFGTASFGVQSLTSIDWDLFLFSLDSQGNFLSATRGGASSGEAGYAIAFDQGLSVCVVGVSSSPSPVFDSVALSNNGQNDGLILKYWVPPSENIVEFRNGSFEFLGGIPANSSVNLFPGDSRLVGWTIGGAGGWVTYANGKSGATLDFGPIDGVYHITFNGGNQSAGPFLSQRFRTTVGEKYAVSFYVGGLGPRSGEGSITATVTSEKGVGLGSLKAIPPLHGYGSVQELVFTADSPTTVLTFLDTSVPPMSGDVVLDAVTVTKLPRLTFNVERLRFSPIQGVRLNLSSTLGVTVRVEGSSDLRNWTTVAVFPNLNNPIEFVELTATNYPMRFYRARAP